jgi:serine/threonine protein kinase
MLDSIKNIARQAVNKCKDLCEKHGTEISLVGKVMVSALLPGGGAFAEILQITCDEIKNRKQDVEQKSGIKMLEDTIVQRLGNDTEQFSKVLDQLDGKLSGTLEQMIEVKENFGDTPTENLYKFLYSKMAKSSELMEVKTEIASISSNMEFSNEKRPEIMDNFNEYKGDLLELIKEQLKMQIAYSPSNQIEGLTQKDAVVYLYADNQFTDAIVAKEMVKAGIHLEEMVKLNPNSAKTKNNQALYALMKKEFEQSEQLINQALERDQENTNLQKLKSLASQTTQFIKSPRDFNRVEIKKGDIIGNKHWKLISKIGSGGMGMVWEAENRLGKKGALKILLSGSQDQKLISIFQVEIDTLEEINHDGIVKILDWGEDQVFKIWFMVMELIEGESLSSYLLRNRPISEEKGFKLLENLAQALLVCYDKNIVHRDIKPANIMLKQGEKPILIDFGIAKQNIINSQNTSTIVLTEAYAAPEQRVGYYSHQSDLYALARTITECFLPQTIQLLSVTNPKKYIPSKIWDIIEPLLDEQEQRGNARELIERLRKIQVSPQPKLPKPKSYYYSKSGAEAQGPVDLDTIVDLINQYPQNFLIWLEGLEEWNHWDQFEEIRERVTKPKFPTLPTLPTPPVVDFVNKSNIKDLISIPPQPKDPIIQTDSPKPPRVIKFAEIIPFMQQVLSASPTPMHCDNVRKQIAQLMDVIPDSLGLTPSKPQKPVWNMLCGHAFNDLKQKGLVESRFMGQNGAEWRWLGDQKNTENTTNENS